jgi:hypothetical protein
MLSFDAGRATPPTPTFGHIYTLKGESTSGDALGVDPQVEAVVQQLKAAGQEQKIPVQAVQVSPAWGPTNRNALGTVDTRLILTEEDAVQWRSQDSFVGFHQKYKRLEALNEEASQILHPEEDSPTWRTLLRATQWLNGNEQREEDRVDQLVALQEKRREFDGLDNQLRLWLDHHFNPLVAKARQEKLGYLPLAVAQERLAAGTLDLKTGAPLLPVETQKPWYYELYRFLPGRE